MKLEDLSSKATYSYADYLTWAFEERIEIIKGKLFKMSPAPSTSHQEISGFLFYTLYHAFKETPCRVYAAPFDVRLAPRLQDPNEAIFTVVQPDICVVCDPQKLDERGCIGAPDLIVEILSPGNSSKEMREKFEVYEENGVKEYWIVAPADRMLLVYVLNEAGRFIGLKPISETEILHSPLFPAIQFDVKEMFRSLP